MNGKVLVSCLLVFLVLLIPNITAQGQEQPGVCYWRGYATVSGSAASTSDVLHAYVNGSLSATGYVRSSTTGFYEAFVNGSEGDNVTFKICGVSVNESAQPWTCGNPGYHTLNLTMTKHSNGAACTQACGCAGGYCCSGSCSSSACSADDDDDGGSGGSSGGVPDDDDDEETAETPVTTTDVVDEILEAISAYDLGMTGELTADDVHITQIGETATATKALTTASLEAAENAATTAEAKSAVQAAKSAGMEKKIDVQVSLATYKVESKETGQSIYVSIVTMQFTAENDMEDVVITQIIPKSVALDIDEITFVGGKPKILQSDPIVQWGFPVVTKGETKDMSYTVKKQLTAVEDTVLATAGKIIIAQPQPICTAGARQCSGNNLQQCSEDGTAWNAVESCEHGCDSSVLACRPAPLEQPDNTMTYVLILIIVVVFIIAFVVYCRATKKEIGG